MLFVIVGLTHRLCTFPLVISYILLLEITVGAVGNRVSPTSVTSRLVISVDHELALNGLINYAADALTNIRIIL